MNFDKRFLFCIFSMFISGISYATPPSDPSSTETAPDLPAFTDKSEVESFIPKRGFTTRVETARLIREQIKRRADSKLLGATPRKRTKVNGVASIPIVLFKYSDADDPKYSSDELLKKIYTAPAPAMTVTSHYEEMSRGAFSLTGTVSGWYTVNHKRADIEVDPDCKLDCGDLKSALLSALKAADKDIDFSKYDSDGPDNDANSIDDDGFVDYIAFVHSDHGGECWKTDGEDANTKIHSHKYSIADRLGTERGFETNDVSAIDPTGQTNVWIDEYVIMPLLSCDRTSLNDIGVFSHEFGHAFGLPDLYGTSAKPQKSAGIGAWGLMGSGNWGGEGGRPDSPTHMTAWSKEYLGWVDPLVIEKDTKDVTIRPINPSGDAVRVDYTDEFDPFDERYLLIEYRRKKGFDQTLASEGLLVTEVNNTVVDIAWDLNKINAVKDDHGINILEADFERNLNETSGTPRANASDPGDVLKVGPASIDFEPTSIKPFGAAICNIRGGPTEVKFDVYVSRQTCPNRLLGGVSPKKEKKSFADVLEEMLGEE